ncbi:unnamed protein product, partial [Prorocentrum cordatum]
AASQKLERCEGQATKFEQELAALNEKLEAIQNDIRGKQTTIEAKAKEIVVFAAEVAASAAKVRQQRGETPLQAGVLEDLIARLGASPEISNNPEMQKLFADLRSHHNFNKFQPLLFKSVGNVAEPKDIQMG